MKMSSFQEKLDQGRTVMQISRCAAFKRNWDEVGRECRYDQDLKLPSIIGTRWREYKYGEDAQLQSVVETRSEGARRGMREGHGIRKWDDILKHLNES